jgi:hypothetical protein
MIPIELYLLLVLTAVTLFLCILNALYLWDLGNEIKKMKKSAEAFRMAERGKPGSGMPPAAIYNLSSGLRSIAGKYHLDSLVISTWDGLLVASYGSRNPDYESAYYSNMFAGGTTIAGDGVRLFEFDNKEIPLVGILRARTTPPNEIIPQIKTDIKSLFETQLGLE